MLPTPDEPPYRGAQRRLVQGIDSLIAMSFGVVATAIGGAIALYLGLTALEIGLMAACSGLLFLIIGALVIGGVRAKSDDAAMLRAQLTREAILTEVAKPPASTPDDIDPTLTVNCVDGKEAVLVITTDKPTKLKAQARIIAVLNGEVERGDPYPVNWREAGGLTYTTNYQDLRPPATVTIALARVSHFKRRRLWPITSLQLLGAGDVVQYVSRKAPDSVIEVEVSVNVFGGSAGRLVFAHHFMLTAKAGSNVVTVRPLAREDAKPTGSVTLSNNFKKLATP